MPSIEIQVLEGVFSDDEKARVIKGVTAGFADVAGQAMGQNTSVRIVELKSGAWGYAGAVLTTEDGLAIKARG